jgi:hypothetical protein
LTLEVVDRRNGQSLPTATGETIIPLVSIKGQLAKSPRVLDPEKLPNPTPLNQGIGPGSEIALRGYKVHPSTIHPGDTLALTLHWQVLQPPQQNYRLEFTLVKMGAEATPVYRWPVLEPIGGEWPTRQWPADYWVQDRPALPIGPEAPAGQFRLLVTWMGIDLQELSTPFDLGAIVVTN